MKPIIHILVALIAWFAVIGQYFLPGLYFDSWLFLRLYPWDVRFTPAAQGTRVNVVITFKSEEDLNKILEMGFAEGFTAAHGNLDQLLG